MQQLGKVYNLPLPLKNLPFNVTSFHFIWTGIKQDYMYGGSKPGWKQHKQFCSPTTSRTSFRKLFKQIVINTKMPAKL